MVFVGATGTAFPWVAAAFLGFRLAGNSGRIRALRACVLARDVALGTARA
jgi:hypothetical protein